MKFTKRLLAAAAKALGLDPAKPISGTVARLDEIEAKHRRAAMKRVIDLQPGENGMIKFSDIRKARRGE